MTRPSDLPPGVSRLPGDEPDDDDAFAAAFAAACRAAGLPEPDWNRLDLNDAAWKVLLVARNVGYDEGFAEGRAEGELDAAARFEPTDEEIAAEPPTPESFMVRHVVRAPDGTIGYLSASVEWPVPGTAATTNVAHGPLCHCTACARYYRDGMRIR